METTGQNKQGVWTVFTFFIKWIFSKVGYRTGISIAAATLCGVMAAINPGVGLALVIPAAVLKVILILQPFASTASVILWGLAGYFAQDRIPRGSFANLQAVASGLASLAQGDKTKLFAVIMNTFKTASGTITPDDVVKIIGMLATDALKGEIATAAVQQKADALTGAAAANPLKPETALLKDQPETRIDKD